MFWTNFVLHDMIRTKLEKKILYQNKFKHFFCCYTWILPT